MISALDVSQRSKAVLAYNVSDLVLGPGADDKTILPEGLKASKMTDRQRAMLLDIVGEWAGIINDSAAATRMASSRPI